ncbi:MAG: hypothetical protein AAGJ46_13160 [Planctomycetota bacterium]
MLFRVALVVCAAASFGCSVSYYEENLASHLPRADGSVLDVQCVSYVKHTVSSVSPKLHPEPMVELIMDERTFVIYADRILLNGTPYAVLPSDANTVLIAITEKGFEVTADGEAVAP